MYADRLSSLISWQVHRRSGQKKCRRLFDWRKQVQNVYIQSKRKALNAINTDVGNAALDLRNIGPVKVSQFCRPLLA